MSDLRTNPEKTFQQKRLSTMTKSFRSRAAVLLAVCAAAAGLGATYLASPHSASPASNRAASTFSYLPYGPYTCKQGYVWRAAVPSDLVCVTPAQRTETANENALGPSRVAPGGGAYGPNTCKSGYVWRETRPSDLVCVPPASRDQARIDNGNAPFTLQAPNATPTNGVYVNEQRLSSPYSVQLYAHATFAPNKRVQFYSYDPSLQHGDRGLTLLADITTDSTGTLASLSSIYGGGGYKNIYFTDCTQVGSNGWLTAPVVVVDQGTGVVSSGWTLTAPWC